MIQTQPSIAWRALRTIVIALTLTAGTAALRAQPAPNNPPNVQARLHVDADFPGGNIVLEKIEGDAVYVRQDLRDTPSWFYWCFRVRGAAGRALTFHFTKSNVIGVRGPLVYQVSDNLAFGQAWNKAENVAKGGKLKSCSAWAAELPGISVACGIELPYANVKGGEVNARTARAFGHDLARALRGYLETVK